MTDWGGSYNYNYQELSAKEKKTTRKILPAWEKGKERGFSLPQSNAQMLGASSPWDWAEKQPWRALAAPAGGPCCAACSLQGKAAAGCCPQPAASPSSSSPGKHQGLRKSEECKTPKSWLRFGSATHIGVRGPLVVWSQVL